MSLRAWSWSLFALAGMHLTTARAATFVTVPTGPIGVVTPSQGLGKKDVGLRFCNPSRCVVVTETEDQLKRLSLLVSAGDIRMAEISDAHRLYLPNAVYDTTTGRFETSFPGSTEFPTASNGLFALAFKSFPEQAWIEAVEARGFTALEPVSRMGYLFLGDRAAAPSLGKLPFVRGLVEIPAGMKRHAVDALLPGDSEGTLADTTVTIVDSPASTSLPVLNSFGPIGHPLYRLGRITAYGLSLTSAEAREISVATPA